MRQLKAKRVKPKTPALYTTKRKKIPRVFASKPVFIFLR